MTNPSLPLSAVAPAFVTMAHRIVWCSVATIARDATPRTRVLHPIWEYTDDQLTGWIATSPLSLKAKHLEHQPAISLTYWDPTQDTCSAECSVRWVDADERAGVWDRFANGPEPVGYDPSIVPGWDSPDAPGFGAIEITPTRLRVMPGSILLTGQGDLLTWEDPTPPKP